MLVLFLIWIVSVVLCSAIALELPETQWICFCVSLSLSLTLSLCVFVLNSIHLEKYAAALSRVVGIVAMLRWTPIRMFYRCQSLVIFLPDKHPIKIVMNAIQPIKIYNTLSTRGFLLFCQVLIHLFIKWNIAWPFLKLALFKQIHMRIMTLIWHPERQQCTCVNLCNVRISLAFRSQPKMEMLLKFMHGALHGR